MSGGIVASSVGKTGCSLGKPDGGAGKAAGAVGKVVRSDGKIVRSDGKIVRSDGKVVSCDGKFVSYGGIVTHCLLDSAGRWGMSPAVPKFPWLAWLKCGALDVHSSSLISIRRPHSGGDPLFSRGSD